MNSILFFPINFDMIYSKTMKILKKSWRIVDENDQRSFYFLKIRFETEIMNIFKNLLFSFNSNLYTT
ncbi:unnamed protein product [marine sediment metagenome]|uniref:Uncharacterized protein n=1 Tax=marine sediment metagenome TaxID=412755 RepID=X0Y9U3_9ZZZZ